VSQRTRDADQASPVATGEPHDALVEVRNLCKVYRRTRGRGGVQAVTDVTLTIGRGETLALVGESGCGKSTLGRTLLQLERPTSGSVRFAGTELTTLRAADLRAQRRHMQLIFQDPHASLDPRMTVGQTINEPLVVHRFGDRAERRRRVGELLERVGLGGRASGRYPHELSGGQRQRVGIARALAVNPQLVVCDEPVSALDVSIQAQVLNLLAELREAFGLTYLFISHNLGVVRHVADRVAVMYLGEIVELAPVDELFRAPRHPYTKALLSAIPLPDPSIERARERIVLTGDLPSPAAPPSGCRFHTRCPFAQPLCAREHPELTDAGDGRSVACHLWEELPPR